MVFQGCFKEFSSVSRNIKWCSRELHGYLKEVQRVCQGSFKDILRQFQGFIKKVSSVFQ